MHQAGEKITVINSDNKHQVTAVLAASLTGEFLPPQIIYIVQGQDRTISSESGCTHRLGYLV